ncbi:MAG: trigger factor [Planctomycetes bacterium]|nr:trigger factor [Planctomycetota bacterium]
MQVTVERLGPCQARIQFTVPSAEFQDTYKRGLQNVASNANMKGFRPGKVPLQVVEKQFGTQLRNDAVEHFVRQAYDQAVKEQGLKIVGFQRVNLDEVKIEDGRDWDCGFEVSLRPEIELTDYKGVAVESELEPVMEPEVDDAIVNLKAQQSRPEPAGDAGLPADGMAVCKVQWMDGERVVLERDNLRLSPKTPTPGIEAAAFEQGLAGARDGETRAIAMTFPPDFPEEALRGKPGTTSIEVKQAYRLIPPTDEEIRRMLNVADEAALRAFVRERLSEAKQQQEDQRIESKILEGLLARHTIELPKMMLDEQTRVRLESAGRELQQQGVSEDKIRETLETQRPAAEEAAAKGLRALFLVQAIGEREQLLVKREDMEAELQQIAARNRAQLEEVREYYTKNKLFDQMAVELLERKVRRFLRENARVTTPA